jgi:hypothetical protein
LTIDEKVQKYFKDETGPKLLPEEEGVGDDRVR